MKYILTSFYVLFLFSCSTHKDTVTRKPESEIETVKATSTIPKRRAFPINEEINPCENYYEHACSKVNASFKLREDRSFHGFSFSDSNERLLEAKKTYLADLPNKKKLSKQGRDLKNLYTACMNEEASKREEKFYVKQIRQELKEIKTIKQFEEFLAKKIGTEDFSYLGFGNIPNQEDASKNDVYFLSGMQTLPERTYYDKEDVFEDLIKLGKDFFDALWEPEAQQRAESVAQFEKDAAQTHLLPVELRDRINSPTGITKEELIKKFPSLRFDLFFTKIPTKTHIRNLSPENFTFINSAFEKIPLEVLKDLYLFHALPAYMDDAFPDFFKKRFDFIGKHLGGPATRPVRNERCTTLLMSKFGMELDKELLHLLFPNFPTERFIRLAEKVRSSILLGLKKNQWLSETSKKAAIDKISGARLQLVKPLKDKDWDFNLPGKFFADKPYTNSRTLSRNDELKSLKELKEPRNPDRWSMGPLTVNAYYNNADNKFVMPIGILQYPFFDPELTDEANLGAVGSVIGHELGHGIDDKGSKYDKKGRLKQWFTESDLNAFNSRGEKLVKQFDVLGLPGRLKLGEVIGDLVGSTFSYQAAFPNKEDSIEKKKTFFLQYARLWCFVARPKLLEVKAKTDPHPDGVARVNEILKNHPAFAETYQCKKNDTMYLPQEDRVHIW